MANGRSVRKRVLSIGIGRFNGPQPPLPFAASDARAFAAALDATTATRLLVDESATTAALDEVVAALAGDEPDDVCVFLVGLARPAGDGVRLATFDGDLSLGPWLRRLAHLPAKRVVVLLDVQRGASGETRPTALDLAPLFSPVPSRTLILADDGGSGSHVSGELQAGIWASHMTSAFAGAPRARREDGALTAGSLRAFLADEVPRSLALAFTDGRRQCPLVLSSSDDDVLDDAPVSSSADASPALSAIGIRFFTEREIPVKALGGFRKSLHTVPADTLASSQAWVIRLAEPDLAREVEETVVRLRQSLRYKRRDVRADGPQEGAASILTPDFSYHVTVRQHSDRPGVAIFRRTLDRIVHLDMASRPEFAAAFPSGFQSLHVPAPEPLDLPALVDSIEDDRPQAVLNIDYPTDVRYCDLELAGFDGRVRLEQDGLTITAAGPATPHELARQFAVVRSIVSG